MVRGPGGGEPPVGVAGIDFGAVRSWAGRGEAGKGDTIGFCQFRRNASRYGFALAILGFGIAASTIVWADPKPDPSNFGVRDIDVRVQPITSFDRSIGAQRKFGKLTFLGGLRLASEEKIFGGWSGIALDADGRGFVAVSDAGLWMTAQLAYEGDRLNGFEGARVGPLKALDGSALKRTRDRDAEALELTGGTTANGELLIAFEQNHRVGRFRIGTDGIGAPSSYVRPDRKSGRMRGLKGFEAITKLTRGRYKGSLMAIAERKHDAQGRHSGWIWSKGKAQPFFLSDIGGFDITGAAALPNGDLIVLERRFTWIEGVRMRLRRVELSELKPGAVIEGEVLLAATMAQDIDNMEGIAVHRDAGGSAVITIMSDDNFNRLLQRTILLQFRLDEEGVRVEAN